MVATYLHAFTTLLEFRLCKRQVSTDGFNRPKPRRIGEEDVTGAIREYGRRGFFMVCCPSDV